VTTAEREGLDLAALRDRYRILKEAGYPNNAALRLALSPHVDLRLAVELVRRGCPPRTAARIVL
jgi:hypothetical protein